MSLGLGLGLDKNNFISAGGFTPLLDTYGGAAAAYSIRLLSSTYTGGLVEIRRSSDNATKAFLPDSNNELSMSSEAVVGSQSLSAFIGSNDGFVVTWYDQSGNSNNATQSTASAQPQIISSGSLITENGKAAIKFNEPSSALITSNYIVEFSANSVSLFVVKQANNVGSDDVYIMSEGDNQSPYSSQFILGDAASGDAIIWVNADTFGTMPTGQALIGLEWDETIIQAYSNGSTNGASGTPLIKSELYGYTAIGTRADQPTSGTFNGKLQEVISYKFDNSANRSDIETNINDFFSIY